MTLYINFRQSGVGGAIVDPYLLEGDGTANPPALQSLPAADILGRVAGKDVLLGVHGFNVNYREGATSFAVLDNDLGLADPSEIFIGVLWPGDYWIPVVNYPFEGSDAMDCGRRLADFCMRWLGGAQSISFVSHSLGARLVLEAITHLVPLRVRMVCLMAGAINDDCLTSEYQAAAQNIDTIFVLASRHDLVVRLGFPIGDPISNVLDHDHDFFRRALGYLGPPAPAAPPVMFPWLIQDNPAYNHGDYLPPASPALYPRVTDYIRRAFRNQPQPRPGAL